MALLDETTIDDEQENLNTDVAQLRELTPEQQAGAQVDPVIKPVKEDDNVPTTRYPGPVIRGEQTKGTSSAVDLSVKENETQMWKEYDEWRMIGRKEGWIPGYIDDEKTTAIRNAKKEEWYLKYYGMTYEQNEKRRKEIIDKYANPLVHIDKTMRGLADLSMGASTDWIMDWVGVLPGLSPLDDFYDKHTKSPTEGMQKMRKMLSIVVPSIWTGNLAAGALGKLPAEMSKLQKLLIGTGAFSVQEAAVIGLSDVGEEHNILRVLADSFPGVFGEKGMFPIAEWAKTLDSDSPSVRKWKNMLETGPLSIAGTVLGAFIRIKGGKGVLEWLEPLDDAAIAYKQKAIVSEAEIEKLIKIQEIDTQLSLGSKNLSRSVENQLISERESIVQSLDKIDDLDQALDALDISATKEQNIAAVNKIKSGADLTEFDPDITPIVDNKRQSVPPANVARNMADTTAIKNGTSVGDPAPIITESMRAKGLMVGSTSRDAVLGVAEQARDLGRFNALVDGFRFSQSEMDDAAWAIYKDIINPETSLDEIRTLFAKDRDVKNLFLGKVKVEYISEEKAIGAAFALRDLTDRFLGRKVAESSARVMDTLGREISSMSEAVKEIYEYADDPRAMDLIIDKMQFLLDEYALNKYISGWQLRNKNWFDRIPPNELDSTLDILKEEFRVAENSIHAKNLAFTKELKRLATENPLAMRPLIDAFVHTNGDVDSLAKLMTWAGKQVTPTGLLKSPDPKELNLFARSTWGVIYNNVLSGLSALRATIGNTSQIILKPITGTLGHAMFGFTDDFAGLTRHMYYNGAVWETNRRAISDAWQMMKKAHKDPTVMMKAYRKDFVFKNDKKWQIMEDMRPVWEQEGNIGRVLQYDMAKTLKEMAQLPWLRYGMTGMVFPDVFTQTHLAHYLSRVRAYDDVFSEFGFTDWKKIAAAEKKHYDSLFDANGMINDNVLKALQGEVALNLDDGLANWINQATTAYPISKFLTMFPRTSSNWVKNSLSWTPITLIPGINKYSKTIWARTDEDIAIALAEHGIDMATTANARVIFENLRAEYTGRLAFSSILTKLGWDYAMSGNIRGNGHYNASRRQKERSQLGYETKTINIAGKWVSFRGIPGVDPILTILGDMAYYARDLDQPFLEDAQAKLMWTISATFLNETPLQGLEPLVAALNGDLTGWTRLAGNAVRNTAIPLASLQGVLSNAITSTQKDIDNSIIKYVQNKIPIASSFLSEEIDIWTGQPLNDISNPYLRILNALSPVKVSGTEEPWRKWLLTTGWDGLSRLRKDSTGSYEYNEAERELIYKYIGEMELWKQLIPLMNNPAYNKQVNLLRSHRAAGYDLDNPEISLKTQNLPIFKVLDKIIKDAQKLAEHRLVSERPDIQRTITDQRQVDHLMKQGDVQGASDLQRKNLETQNLLQMTR